MATVRIILSSFHRRLLTATICCIPLLQTLCADLHPHIASSASQSRPVEPTTAGHPLFLSPQFQPILSTREFVLVANTPSDTVDVLDKASLHILKSIPVGIEPVSLALRPDQLELWVANHVSDSVSVISLAPESPLFLHVIDTIQDLDPVRHSTRFDEPVGIAFASNSKAYVALSSNNRIAVVNVTTRQVTHHLTIPAQDPRAIVVRNEKLFVIPFESGNQTQLSGGSHIDGDLVTFNAWEHSIKHNNVLSLGHTVDIVKHPRVPDRDLFIFDTKTDQLLQTISSIGTLLYGITIDSLGGVYIAQTDARNDANGRAGTLQHGLAELQNRPFLNRVTKITPADPAIIEHFELEPLPPENPDNNSSLATPFALAITDDNSVLVGTASGSDKLFTIDSATGRILGKTPVGATPQGLALECTSDGEPYRAWVLNAVDNSVSVVDLTHPDQPAARHSIALPDPTPPEIRKGRHAFETALASTTGTFSCASCHPNGHTDQLLWVLATPVVSGGTQIMPRSTMPVRGLRDTEPFHWDGIPGDPYGGINSANVHRAVPPNVVADQPESSIRHLLDGALSTTMKHVEDTATNASGQPGHLNEEQRQAMAAFLLSIPFPPAPERSYHNQLSKEAIRGFSLFHIEGDLDPSKQSPNVCGDCHRMPYWVSTDTPGTGMDAPTWRGAYDRWLILPQGRLNIIDFDFYRRVAEAGADERSIWRFSWGGRPRFDPVWNMVVEGSTGFSGAFARQLTLNSETAKQPLHLDLFQALQNAALDETILLRGEGLLQDAQSNRCLELQFEASKGRFIATHNRGTTTFTSDQLVNLSAKGDLTATFTARSLPESGPPHPQPAIWTLGPIQQQSGRQQFPTLSPGRSQMTVSARHVQPGAVVLVNGKRVKSDIVIRDSRLTIALAELPPPGLHFLQVQNPRGLCSNDFIFHVRQDTPPPTASPPHHLMGTLAEHSWADIEGTWISPQTERQRLTISFRWILRDHGLEFTIQDGEKTTTSLVTLNPSQHQIFQSGADSDGNSIQARWEFTEANEILMHRTYISASGSENSLRLSYSHPDPNTIRITLHLPEPVTFRVIRAQEPNKGPSGARPEPSIHNRTEI
ncbi:MAG: hypothetical protein ACO34E_02265 [Limisphaerales bacterium]